MKVAVMALGLVLFAGCINLEGQLRTRAAFDLTCNETQLTVVKFDPWRRGVSGCEKKPPNVLAERTGVAHEPRPHGRVTGEVDAQAGEIANARKRSANSSR